MIDGSVTVGPNAVQGWKREGYGKFNFSVRDTMETLTFPGYWKFSSRHWRSGLREYRNSLSKREYLKQIRKYCPGIDLQDLEPYPAAGGKGRNRPHFGTWPNPCHGYYRDYRCAACGQQRDGRLRSTSW